MNRATTRTPAPDRGHSAGDPGRGRGGLLAHGTTLVVRPLVTGDREALRALHARASDDSIYKRFFSGNRSAAQSFVDGICAPGTTTHSLVALRRGEVVGVATTIDVPHGEAEVALLVEESLHGVGIGSVLLERLAYDARARGTHHFTAEVLAGNGAMLRVFHDLGFGLVEQRDHEVLSLSLDLTLEVAAIEAADARHRHARAASLRPMLEPRTVAVVGVSRTRGGVGLGGGREPPGGRLPGHRLRRRASRAVRRRRLLRARRDRAPHRPRPRGRVGAARGGRGDGPAARGARRRTCVVLTSGLAETGADGATVERRLAAVARAHDMRLVGPNCFGCSAPCGAPGSTRRSGPVRPEPGSLAVGSQSGGVGVALLTPPGPAGWRRRLRVAGQQGRRLGQRPALRVARRPGRAAAALYLESFHDPRTFARLGRLVQPYPAPPGGLRRELGGPGTGAGLRTPPRTPPRAGLSKRCTRRPEWSRSRTSRTWWTRRPC